MFFSLRYTAAPATKLTRVTYQRFKELLDEKTAIKMKSGSGFGVTAMETGFKHTFRAAIDNMKKKNWRTLFMLLTFEDLYSHLEPGNIVSLFFHCFIAN